MKPLIERINTILLESDPAAGIRHLLQDENEWMVSKPSSDSDVGSGTYTVPQSALPLVQKLYKKFPVIILPRISAADDLDSAPLWVKAGKPSLFLAYSNASKRHYLINTEGFNYVREAAYLPKELLGSQTGGPLPGR